jgi:hypothetical protein
VTVGLASVAGTVRTERRGRIEVQPAFFDLFLAIHAYAIGAGVHTGERGTDAGNLDNAPLFGGLRHRLVLQGIHPRQAADALLVERHRLQRIGGLGAKLLHLRTKIDQALANLIVGFDHGGCEPSRRRFARRFPWAVVSVREMR